MLLQLHHRLGQVGHPQIGLPLQRAARRLGQRAGLRRRMVARRDHRPRAEHLGRPQHRAHVVRVRHPVQQHHQRRPRPRNRHILQRPSSAAAPPAPPPDAPTPRRWARRTCAGPRSRAPCPLRRWPRPACRRRSSSPPAAASRAPGSPAHRAPHAGRTARRSPSPRPAWRVPCRSPMSVSWLRSSSRIPFSHPPSMAPEPPPMQASFPKPHSCLDAPSPLGYPPPRVGRRAARCGSGL
jgi:hypothetical protein